MLLCSILGVWQWMVTWHCCCYVYADDEEAVAAYQRELEAGADALQSQPKYWTDYLQVLLMACPAHSGDCQQHEALNHIVSCTVGRCTHLAGKGVLAHVSAFSKHLVRLRCILVVTAGGSASLLCADCAGGVAWPRRVGWLGPTRRRQQQQGNSRSSGG